MSDAKQALISWQLWLAGVILLSAVGVMSFFVYRAKNPSDRVQVVIVNPPADAIHAGIIVDRDGKLTCVLQSVDFSTPNRDRFLKWEKADRYGVVLEMIDETYQVIWFEPEEIQSDGKVVFDLASKKGNLFPRDEAKRLGLTWEPHE